MRAEAGRGMLALAEAFHGIAANCRENRRFR
jgi:hypothetical protein